MFGAFSAEHAQLLVVQHTLEHAIRLCVVGEPQTCTGLASSWPRPLPAVPHRHSVLDPLASHLSLADLMLWLLAGIVVMLLALVFGATKAGLYGDDNYDDASGERDHARL